MLVTNPLPELPPSIVKLKSFKFNKAANFCMHVWIFIILFLLSGNIYAQTHRIDSIKKILPSLSGHAEVNSLNALNKEFNFYWPHSDSVLKYTTLGYSKASKIKYNTGKAEALLMRAAAIGRLLGQPVEMEKLCREALGILKNENDLKTLSMAYYYLGIGLAMQGLYHEAEQTFKKAKELALIAKDKFSIGWAKQGFGFMYFKSGKYWKSFPHLIEAQQIGKEVNDSVLTSLSLAIIARTFNMAGDPQEALRYYHEAFHYGMPFIKLWGHHGDMAYAHLQLKQYDSAVYYEHLNMQDFQTNTTDLKARQKFRRFSQSYSIDIHLAKKEYDSVLLAVLPGLPQLRKTRDIFPLMLSLFVVAKAYQGKGNYKQSLLYTRELYQLANKFPAKRFLRDANDLLASTYVHLKQGDSAYHYLKQYMVIKDSMETVQYAGRTALYLAASESESKIRLLNKDKEINMQQLALNKKELQKQAQLKNLLLVSLVVLFLFSVVVVRNTILKRKNEKLKSEQAQSQLKRKALELEMQALRAQMNPHFIFNCLSAIDNLIQTHQGDKATSYLSRFAKLIRGVLDSSKNNVVPFQKDFETLKLYLEMEQFRCNNKFSYQLTADDELLQGDYKVPPLIIQPFIENAIHHGLLNKQDSNRQLSVSAHLSDEQIIYSVTDNGIGRRKAAIIKEMNRPGQQSYGIDITRERIHLHNKNGINNDVLITDLEKEGMPAGTKAIVRISSEV